jgi:hypothetical protein
MSSADPQQRAVDYIAQQGIVDYIAYGCETDPRRYLQDVGGQGFTPVATSLDGRAVDALDRRIGGYAEPRATGVGDSVCRLLVDGRWAVIGVRSYVGPDARRDARGYLLIGHPEDLTPSLALRLLPERRPATPTGQGDDAAPADLEQIINGAGWRPLAPDSIRRAAVTQEQMDQRKTDIDRLVLIRLATAALRYGASTDRDRHLLLPDMQAADSQLLLWCLFNLLRRDALRAAAGPPTFTLSQTDSLLGEAAAVAPRYICTHGAFTLYGRQDRCVEIGPGWQPEHDVFGAAAERLVESYLAGADDLDDTLAQVGRIDSASADTVGRWCAHLVGADPAGIRLPPAEPRATTPPVSTPRAATPAEPQPIVERIMPGDGSAPSRPAQDDATVYHDPAALLGSGPPRPPQPAPAAPGPFEPAAGPDPFSPRPRADAPRGLDAPFVRPDTPGVGPQVHPDLNRRAFASISRRLGIDPNIPVERQWTAVEDRVVELLQTLDMRDKELDIRLANEQKLIRQRDSFANALRPTPPTDVPTDYPPGDVDSAARHYPAPTDPAARPGRPADQRPRWTGGAGERTVGDRGKSSLGDWPRAGRLQPGEPEPAGPADRQPAAGGEGDALAAAWRTWLRDLRSRVSLAASLGLGIILIILIALIAVGAVGGDGGPAAGGAWSAEVHDRTGQVLGRVTRDGGRPKGVPRIFADAAFADAAFAAAHGRPHPATDTGADPDPIVLTLDSTLQRAAEEFLARSPTKKGAVVVVDPSTGDVLAIAESSPGRATEAAQDPGDLSRLALAGASTSKQLTDSNRERCALADAVKESSCGPQYFKRLHDSGASLASLCPLGFNGPRRPLVEGVPVATSTIGTGRNDCAKTAPRADPASLRVTPLQQAIITAAIVRAVSPGGPRGGCPRLLTPSHGSTTPAGTACPQGALGLDSKAADEIVKAMQGAYAYPQRPDLGLMWTGVPGGRLGWATGFSPGTDDHQPRVVTAVIDGAGNGGDLGKDAKDVAAGPLLKKLD